MSELLLVNPRRRHRRRKVTSLKRNPRRKRRAMTALQAQYFGGGRKRRHSRRRAAVAAAPGKRRHRRRSIRRAFAGRTARLAGFNPRSFLSDTLMPSAIGAVGAIGADVLLGYATPYLPSILTTGIGATVAKLGAAVGLGAVAGMVTNRRMGEQVMAGAITVVLYSVIKQQVKASLPNMPGLGYAGPARAFPDRLNGMGMYVSDQPPVPPAVVAAIAQSAAANAAGKTAPSAQTVGEYVSGYESRWAGM